MQLILSKFCCLKRFLHQFLHLGLVFDQWLTYQNSIHLSVNTKSEWYSKCLILIMFWLWSFYYCATFLNIFAILRKVIKIYEFSLHVSPLCLALFIQLYLPFLFLTFRSLEDVFYIPEHCVNSVCLNILPISVIWILFYWLKVVLIYRYLKARQCPRQVKHRHSHPFLDVYYFDTVYSHFHSQQGSVLIYRKLLLTSNPDHQIVFFRLYLPLCAATNWHY